MEESVSVRRWKLAERLERRALHPKVKPETRENALRAARMLKRVVERHEVRKLTAILEKHGSR
jgi:hypothetical protein